MKMKKFLIFYLLFILFLIVSFFSLRPERRKAQKPAVQKKKIVLIITEEMKPCGRVICKTPNGVIFMDWMSAENAIIEKEEMMKRYRGNSEIFIQYDKWPY